MSEQSDKIDLSSEDQVPDELFTAIIWKTVLGEDAVVPAPRRGAFIKTEETEKDED